MSASALSTLCQQCGLCCNGSLFTFLPVSEEECARMQALHGCVQKRRDGRLALLLPCPSLKGTCCGAYAQRPARCREFVCHLGRAVERAERPLEGAQAIVDEAKARLEQLANALEPAADPTDPRSILQRALQVEATEPNDARFHRVRTMAREVEVFLQAYFVDGP